MGKRYWVPLDQIQGNITPGFRKDHQAFLFLRFTRRSRQSRSATQKERSRIQTWLGELQPHIASGLAVATFNQLHRQVKDRIDATVLDDTNDRNNPTLGVKRFIRSTWINVAFTAQGLGCLLQDEGWNRHQTHTASLTSFIKGMCSQRATTADTPGDIGGFVVRDSTPSDVPGLSDDLVADAVIIIGADDTGTLDTELRRQEKLARRHALVVIGDATMRGQTLGGGREHFGFKDTLSQPDPDDPLAGWVADEEQIVAPGEFIRGCEPEKTDAADAPVWERHGSYLVIRKLKQNVEDFWAQARAIATELYPDAKEEILQADHRQERPESVFTAAKLMGRWPSGAILTEPAERDKPPPSDPGDDPTSFASTIPLDAGDIARDPGGVGCPLFAHSRRARRRVLSEDMEPEDLRIHRIIRRGIPYEDTTDNTKGLIFLCYQARLDDGYEYVQREWLNSYLIAGDGATGGQTQPGQDPLSVTIGRVGKLNMPVRGGGDGAGSSIIDYPFTRVVEAKGGGYYFAPSIPALGLLASGSTMLRA
jgi:Dyp-type peroxidase family